MKKFVVLLAGYLMAASLPLLAVAADTAYVKPQANIPLLADANDQAVVVRRLSPGEPVTILSRQTGFASVQTADGLQGWLRDTMITDVAPPTAQVTALTAQNAQLQQQITDLEARARSAEADARQAHNALNATQSSNGDQLAAAQAQNEDLKAKYDELEKKFQDSQSRVAELEMAQNANQLLANTHPPVSETSSTMPEHWLLLASGAGLLMFIVGMLIGSSVVRRRLRQRYHGMEL